MFIPALAPMKNRGDDNRLAASFEGILLLLTIVLFLFESMLKR